MSKISDDEPLYDSVASDEDYAVLPPINQEKIDNPLVSNIAQSSAVDVLTKRLLQSDSTISDLKAEVRVLQSMVKQLSTENTELKTRLSQNYSVANGSDASINLRQQVINTSNEIQEQAKLRRNQRPNSMYETREGLRVPNWHILKQQVILHIRDSKTLTTFGFLEI